MPDDVIGTNGNPPILLNAMRLPSVQRDTALSFRNEFVDSVADETTVTMSYKIPSDRVNSEGGFYDIPWQRGLEVQMFRPVAPPVHSDSGIFTDKMIMPISGPFEYWLDADRYVAPVVTLDESPTVDRLLNRLKRLGVLNQSVVEEFIALPMRTVDQIWGKISGHPRFLSTGTRTTDPDRLLACISTEVDWRSSSMSTDLQTFLFHIFWDYLTLLGMTHEQTQWRTLTDPSPEELSVEVMKGEIQFQSILQNAVPTLSSFYDKAENEYNKRPGTRHSHDLSTTWMMNFCHILLDALRASSDVASQYFDVFLDGVEANMITEDGVNNGFILRSREVLSKYKKNMTVLAWIFNRPRHTGRRPHQDIYSENTVSRVAEYVEAVIASGRRLDVVSSTELASELGVETIVDYRTKSPILTHLWTETDEADNVGSLYRNIRYSREIVPPRDEGHDQGQSEGVSIHTNMFHKAELATNVFTGYIDNSKVYAHDFWREELTELVTGLTEKDRTTLSDENFSPWSLSNVISYIRLEAAALEASSSVGLLMDKKFGSSTYALVYSVMNDNVIPHQWKSGNSGLLQFTDPCAVIMASGMMRSPKSISFPALEVAPESTTKWIGQSINKHLIRPLRRISHRVRMRASINDQVVGYKIVNDARKIVLENEITPQRSGGRQAEDAIAGKFFSVRHISDMWNAASSSFYVDLLSTLETTIVGHDEEYSLSFVQTKKHIRAIRFFDRYYPGAIYDADSVLYGTDMVFPSDVVPLELDSEDKLKPFESQVLGSSHDLRMSNYVYAAKMLINNVDRFPAALLHLTHVSANRCLSGQAMTGKSEEIDQAMSERTGAIYNWTNSLFNMHTRMTQEILTPVYEFGSLDQFDRD